MRGLPTRRALRSGAVILHSALLASLAIAAPTRDGPHTAPAGTFVDITESCGIGIVSPSGERGDWGHGCAFVDYDNDGDTDLYVGMNGGQPNRLFQNTGASSFVDVGPTAGVASTRDARGVVWADYDNDGNKDCFVANFKEACQLFHNNGDGTFTDVAETAGVSYTGESHSASWADYNNDGFLDLYVGTYGRQSELEPKLLFSNNGDGTFTEVAAAAGIDEPDKPALANAWLDYDDDGDLDLYVAYDKLRGNSLWRNEGDGTFTDVSAASNTNLYFNAMGIAVGDYDHNGYLDMYVTNTAEGNELLRNNGDGTFDRVADALGVAVNQIGWGCAFLDYDNDGDEDLYVVNWWAYTWPEAKNQFFRNTGLGGFNNVTDGVGVGNEEPAYALAVGDYNNDGFLDMFVNNQDDDLSDDYVVPSVFFENVPTNNHWLKIKTVGVVSNRDGVGAKIRVTTGGLTQLKDVRAGSSYLSQLSPEVEFGLGSATTISAIQITWPSGTVDTWVDVPADQYLVANEGGSLHPVPVLISRFFASPVAGGIELQWVVSSDEAIKGFRVYRTETRNTRPVILNTALLPFDADHYTDATAQPGERYDYTLGVVLTDGSEVLSQPSRVTMPAARLALGQNYPNPFNPVTTISFVLPERQHARLDVFDAGGRFVARLLDEARDAGAHQVPWRAIDRDGQPVASGVYFYRLVAGERVLTKRMVLLK